MQTTTPQPRFTTDSFTTSYEAIAYGPTWNGWVTPVVTRETLEAIESAESGEGEYFSVTFDADGVATFTDDGCRDSDVEAATMVPNADGGYDLGALGWCFDTAETN